MTDVEQHPDETLRAILLELQEQRRLLASIERITRTSAASGDRAMRRSNPEAPRRLCDPTDGVRDV